MSPTENFSQKKKKDLVAIASLFGILPEEKANRMTRQELLDVLHEQDRKSRDSEVIGSDESGDEVTDVAKSPDMTPIEAIDIPADLTSSDETVNTLPQETVIHKDIKKAHAQPKTTVGAAKAPRSRTVSKKSTTESNTESSIDHPLEQKKTESPLPQVPETAEEAIILPAVKNADTKESANSVPQIENTPKHSGKSSPSTRRSHNTDARTRSSSAGSREDGEAILDKNNESEILPDSKDAEQAATTSFDSIDKGSEPLLLNGDIASNAASTTQITAAADDSIISNPTVTESVSPESSIAIEGASNSIQSAAKSAEPMIPTASDGVSPVAATGRIPGSQPGSDSAVHGRTRRRSVIIVPKDEMIAEGQTDLTKTGADVQEPITLAEDTSPESAPAAHPAKVHKAKEPVLESLTGVLEIIQDGGYGFLRRENYLQGQNDVYVAASYIRRFNLRMGDLVTGFCRPKKDNERYPAIQFIQEVNGDLPEKMIRRVNFDRLTPIYPDQKYILETEKNELSTRIIDLVAPIGKGQRGMIVSPPKAGKTILLQKIANAISVNNPDAKLIVLLIDERPEEVTDMQRSINGEVVYSTFDKTPENHTKVTELVLERAMRLVELGQDVVILLDSITRLARAYNLTINPTGRTLSGGLDPGALYGPKRFFGAARNIENGGSLTIIATSLIDTGSRMDEVIFEEFKGTGNMEVYLDRKLSEKRIFPAIDINKSGTRREELLLSQLELDAVWTIRKAFSQLDTAAVTEMIISLLLKTSGNNQFVQSVNVSFNDKATFEAMRGTRLGGNGTPGGAQQNQK